MASLEAFYTLFKDRLPAGLVITIPNVGDTISDTTGEITGSWSEAAPATVTGDGGGSYVAGTGGRVRWHTTGVVGGRRVVGTTFICPIMNGNLAGTSGLTSSFTTTLQSAADGLIEDLAGTMKIFSPPTPTRAGTSSFVDGATVPTATSWLRSRRT